LFVARLYKIGGKWLAGTMKSATSREREKERERERERERGKSKHGIMVLFISRGFDE